MIPVTIVVLILAGLLIAAVLYGLRMMGRRTDQLHQEVMLDDAEWAVTRDDRTLLEYEAHTEASVGWDLPDYQDHHAAAKASVERYDLEHEMVYDLDEDGFIPGFLARTASLRSALSEAQARIAELENGADTPLEMATEALLKRNKELEHELYGTKDSLRIVGDLLERYRAERDAARAAQDENFAECEKARAERDAATAEVRRVHTAIEALADKLFSRARSAEADSKDANRPAVKSYWDGRQDGLDESEGDVRALLVGANPVTGKEGTEK
jgi:hypothetical protein